MKRSPERGLAERPLLDTGLRDHFTRIAVDQRRVQNLDVAGAQTIGYAALRHAILQALRADDRAARTGAKRAGAVRDTGGLVATLNIHVLVGHPLVRARRMLGVDTGLRR